MSVDTCRGLVLLAVAVVVAALAPLTTAEPAGAGGRRDAAAADTGGRLDDGGTLAMSTQALAALGRGLQADPGKAPAMSARVRSVAGQRKEALLRLLDVDPQLAVDQLLPDGVIDALEPLAGGLLEHKTTASGRLSVFHHHAADQDDDGHSTFTPTVDTPTGPVTIVSNGRMPTLPPGAEVSVSGYQIDQTIIAVAAGSASPAPIASGGTTGAATPLGPLSAAVVFANFANSSTSIDPTPTRNAFQGTPGADVVSWYAEASYGKAALVPSFFGPYTIADTTTATGGCPNLTTAGDHLMTAANADITYAQHRRLIFVFNCTGYGASSNVGEALVATPQGSITAAITAVDATSAADRQTFAHELAHNLGNYHAALAVCTPIAFIPPTRFDEGCASAEYGNEFDTLGATLQSPRATPHLNALHKRNAGWFDPSNVATPTTPGTTTYTLRPYENPTDGVLALSIPRGGSGTSFTVEYRQPVGFDAWMGPSSATYCKSQCTATQGATIQLVQSLAGSSGGSDTQAIDTTPGSIQSSSYHSIADNRDGALLPGRTFTDPEYGITIATESADASGAVVHVTVPAAAFCTRQAPTATLVSPSTVSSAGGAGSYRVRVTSNDSASCPALKHKYAGGRLTGVTASGSAGSFTAVATPDVFSLSPGGSVDVDVTLTPDATVVAGAYGFQLTSSGGIGTITTNDLAVPVVKLPNVTFQMAGTGDTTAPTAPANLVGQALGSSAVGISWSPSTDNVGIAGYKVVESDGSLFWTTATTFVDPSTPASASVSFMVQAFDRQGNFSAVTSVTAATPARTDTVAPRAPGAVTASAGDRSVTVGWAPSADNTSVIGYLISPFNLWLPPSATSATVTGLSTSTTFQVRVQAFDGWGNSSSTTAGGVTATTASAGTNAPARPVGLYSPWATTAGGINLTWRAGLGGSAASMYRIYRNSRPWATVSGTSYTDTNVYASAGYQYLVQAVDATGNVSSPTSFVQTIAPSASTSDSTAPTAVFPTQPSEGTSVSGSVAVSASPTDAVGVKSVELHIDGSYVAASSSTPVTFTWNSASTGNGPHTLSIRAYDAAGNYATAGLVTVIVANVDAAPPSTPSQVAASSSATPRIDLTWTPSTDNSGVTRYAIYRDGVDVASVTDPVWSDSAVTAASVYSYSVVAWDAAGNQSPPTSPISVSTPAAAPPPAPTPAASGVIAGTVTRRSTGAALAGAQVAITVNGRKTTATTAANGSYTLASLPAATYTVTFSAKGLKSQTRTATVTAAQTTTIDVAL